MSEDLKDAIATLERKRAVAQALVEKLDTALQLLRDLDDQPHASSPAHANHTNGGRPLARTGGSVRSKILRLANERDRDWSTAEIIEEFERRGDPIKATDPANAIRTAFAEAMKREQLVRTTTGRYR